MIPPQGLAMTSEGGVAWLVATPFGPWFSSGSIEEAIADLEKFIPVLENLLDNARVQANATPEQLAASLKFTETWGDLMGWQSEDDLDYEAEVEEGWLAV